MRQTLVWLVVVAVFVLLLGGEAIPGWLLAVVVVAAIVLGMVASVKQSRVEGSAARAWWRTLTRR